MSLTFRAETKSIIRTRQTLEVVKMCLPDELRKKTLSIAEKYKLKQEEIKGHDNLVELDGRTSWKFHTEEECRDTVIPDLVMFLRDGLKDINHSDSYPHIAIKDLWVAWYNENSKATLHNHLQEWYGFSFVWYLGVENEYTSIVFLDNITFEEVQVVVKPNDLLIFNGRTPHYAEGREKNRIVASANMYCTHHKYFDCKADE